MNILEISFYRRSLQPSNSFQTSKCLVTSSKPLPRLESFVGLDIFLSFTIIFILFLLCFIGMSVPNLLEDSIIYWSRWRKTWICGIKYFHGILEKVSAFWIMFYFILKNTKKNNITHLCGFCRILPSLSVPNLCEHGQF